MPTKSNRPPTAADPDTRERILRVAAEAWHAKSFDGVGTAEICRLAKVHKGSFFHFFPSKDDLLLAVLERYAHDIGAALRDGPFRRDVPPRERFARFFVSRLERVRGEIERVGCWRGCPIGNIVIELGTRNENARRAAAKVFDVMQDVFAEAIDDARTADGRGFDVDTKTAAATVLAFVQGLTVLGKAYGDPRQLERVAMVMLAGLGVSKPRARRKTKRR